MNDYGSMRAASICEQLTCANLFQSRPQENLLRVRNTSSLFVLSTWADSWVRVKLFQCHSSPIWSVWKWPLLEPWVPSSLVFGTMADGSLISHVVIEQLAICTIWEEDPTRSTTKTFGPFVRKCRDDGVTCKSRDAARYSCPVLCDYNQPTNENCSDSSEWKAKISRGPSPRRFCVHTDSSTSSKWSSLYP